MAIGKNDAQAISRIREFAKWSIIATIIGVVAVVISYAYLITSLLPSLLMSSLGGAYGYQSPSQGTPFSLVLAIIFCIVEIIFVILMIVKIRGAFNILSASDPARFSIPSLLVNILAFGLLGGIILIIIGLAVGIFAIIGVIVFAIAGVSGAIGIPLGLYRVGTAYGNMMLRIGAILSPFSGIPGIIMIFIGARELDEKTSSAPAPAPKGPALAQKISPTKPAYPKL